MGRWVISGGAFDYNQYKIGYIADQIEEVIVKNGVKKTPEEIKDEIINVSKNLGIQPEWLSSVIGIQKQSCKI